jgi:hypothetical protein
MRRLRFGPVLTAILAFLGDGFLRVLKICSEMLPSGRGATPAVLKAQADGPCQVI